MVRANIFPLTVPNAAIRALKDKRQDVYRELRELSANPLDVTLAIPRSRLQPTIESREDGAEVPLPLYEMHLLSDENGLFPEDFKSSWEIEVLTRESSRDDAVAWYRNPSSASPESLGVVYPDDEQQSILRPDFIFFSMSDAGQVQAHIIDPHGQFLADSLPKLLGLCDYAEEHAVHYGRIEAVAKVGEVFRALDLTDAAVRDQIRLGPSAKSLFEGPASKDYPG